MGFICAKWIRLDDGCVARCDKDHTHLGRHLDSIIDICWPDNDPRMEAEDARRPRPPGWQCGMCKKRNPARNRARCNACGAVKGMGIAYREIPGELVDQP